MKVVPTGVRSGHSAPEGSLLAGRFRVAQTVRHSPSSTAYLAEDITTGRDIFLRLIPTDGASPGAMARMEQEAAVLESIGTPQIVPLLAHGQEKRHFWFAFSRPAGRSLAAHLRSARLDCRPALELFRSLLSGLRALHGRGLLHRALRPDSLFLEDLGRPAGVEIAGYFSPDAVTILQREGSQTPRLIDVVRYLPPEQTGVVDEPLSEASNIYSAGCILFECLSGRSPFEGTSLNELLHRQATRPAPPVRELGVSVPRVVDEILQRCLARDSRVRYQSVEAVAADVEALLERLNRGEHDPDLGVGAQDRRGVLVESAFVARAEELRQLNEAFAGTLAGNADLTFVEGESGFGKTRLLSEFGVRISQTGALVLRGRATTESSHQPLELIEGVAAGVMTLAHARTEFDRRLRDRLSADLPLLAEALPTLGPLASDASGVVGEAGPGGESRTLGAIARLFDALGTAEEPIVIILDDCQWAADLVHRLLQHWRVIHADKPAGTRHVQIVVSFRADEVPPGHPLRRVPHAHAVRVGALGAEDIRRLAESMAGRLPEAALETVIRLSDGVPFMASAILHGLVETKAILPGPDGWRVDEGVLTQAGFATQAASFLSRRLDLLDPEVRRFLAAGAVLGRTFDLKFAMELSGVRAEGAFTAAQEARQRHLLWLNLHDGSGTFSHDRIRESLLGQLTEEEIRRFHRQVADYLEVEHPERIAELAHHLDAAGEHSRALRYAIEAARRAHQHHALELAEEQYRIAQRGVTGAARQTQFLVADGLGEVLMLRGKYEGAQRLFDLAARLADGPAAEADVRSKQGELFMKRGDMEAAAQEFERGLALLGASIPRNRVSLGIKLVVEAVIQVAHTLLPRLFVHTRPRTPDPRERLSLRLYSGLSHACWYCRSLPLAMWAHLRGMNCGEVFQPSLELAQIYSNHAPAMVLTAAYGRGEQYALKSLQIRRELGDQWGQGQSYHYHGIVLYAAARYDECIEKCRQSIQILERMGDLWQVHIARYQIAACLYRLGDLEGALDECRRNYASGITLGDEQASGIILDVWVRATGGHLPPSVIDQELGRARTDAQGQAQVLLAKAIQLIAAGDPAQAVELLGRARETVRRAGVSNPYTLPIRAWLVTAWRTSAQADTALGPARRTASLRQGAWELRKAILEAWRYPHELPHLYRELGLIEAMLGRPRRAWRAFEKSLRAAERLDAQVESAITRTARARLSREMGWTDAVPPVPVRSARLRSGESLIRRLESALRIGEETAPTISLVDRFDMLLKSGRTITSALSFTLIGKAVQTAAERLLRSERVYLLPVDPQGHPTTRPERGGMEYDESLVLRAIDLRQVVSAQPSERTGLRDAHAALCAPVMVRGEITCVLYAVCPDLRQAVGTDEERIADFIATLAGAALENAEGFQKLEQLNATLEARVLDRTAAVQERAEQLAASNEELARVANELREAEVQLVASTHAAQDANRAKSRFLAAMSHEIRTPMNGIIGMAELALSTELTERQRGYLNTVGRSARSLLAMLNDVLDFSKIEAGKMDIDSIPFDLHETVADAARLLAVPIAAKGLDLDVRIAADVPAQATGDPNRLRQILVNLIGNALKFTAQGRIGITVTREAVPAAWGLSGAGQVHFVVTDTGIGISPQNQQRIFEAFDQGEASVTRRFGGTGLGLSISSQLVALMHGRIWVESQEGVGSAFHVALPLPVSAVLATTAAGSDAARNAESWVVFARDPSVVALHERRLSATGREVWGTSLFSETKSHYFERSATTRPPALLIDLPLQAAHELSLIERLIDEQHLTPTDVVALIPGGAEAIYQALAGRGLQTIIEKPVTPAGLLEVLDRRSASAGLPVAPDAAVAPTEAGLRILVVDDSEVNRDVAEGLLEMLGHRPATADSGVAALARLAAETFDVVLMDIEMPEMDGLTAARRYRAQEGETDSPLPILAMTAHASGGFHRECEKAGMTGLIHKPVQPEELKRILAAIPARSAR